MSGRHDKRGDEDVAARLLATGPIVVRGLSRGVRDHLVPHPSRHRAPGGTSRPGDGLEMPAGSRRGEGPHAVPPTEPPMEESFEDIGGGGTAERRGRGPSNSVVVSSADEASAEDASAPGSAPGAGGDAARADDVVTGHSLSARAAGPVWPSWRDRLSREVMGVAVLVVLALVCAGLIVAVVRKSQSDAETAARAAAAYTPPALPSAAPTIGDTGPVVTLVGDESVEQAAPAVEGSARWPALLAEEVAARIVPMASAGSGYVTSGADGATFVEAAGRVPADSAVVVFLGGTADEDATTLDIATAATRAFAAAAEQAPDAEIVAIGPLVAPDGDATATADLRRSIQSAARIVDVRWVDPIRAEWLSAGVSATAPNPSAERAVAARMASLLDPGLG